MSPSPEEFNESARGAAETHRWRGLDAYLKSQILGQDPAIGEFADALLAGEMGHARPGRPASLLLLLGPTGTGKTQAAVEAARHLHGENAIVRINLGEFASEERAGFLIGSGGSPGFLGESVKRLRAAGGRILLLDEIEKAHRRVSDLLLGMESGFMGGGADLVDLSGLHMILTSNLGTSEVIEMDGVARASIRRHLEQEAAAFFRPEAFARFTAVVVFNRLPRDAQARICARMIDDEAAYQARALSLRFGHPVRLHVGAGVSRRLLSEGFHRTLGARPLRNVIERRLRGALVESRLRGALGPGVSDALFAVDEARGVRAKIVRSRIALP